MSVSVDNAVHTMFTDVNPVFITGGIKVWKDSFKKRCW